MIRHLYRKVLCKDAIPLQHNMVVHEHYLLHILANCYMDPNLLYTLLVILVHCSVRRKLIVQTQ